tara:strand:+ start:626 stop:787 length:162 start_codon:yes stop_codon:yes gene_type:complete
MMQGTGECSAQKSCRLPMNPHALAMHVTPQACPQVLCSVAIAASMFASSVALS